MRIEYTNLEDIFALEAVYAEMTRLIPLIESGEVAPESGFLRIHSTGTSLAFSMNLATKTVTGYTREGDDFKAVGIEPKKAFTNYLEVYVIIPGGEVKIAGYDLYCGMSSALRVAHDFEVMRALIDGKPEAEILGMKPIREPEPRLNSDIRTILKELREQLESAGPVREEQDPENPTVEQPDT